MQVFAEELLTGMSCEMYVHTGRVAAESSRERLPHPGSNPFPLEEVLKDSGNGPGMIDPGESHLYLRLWPYVYV